MYITEYTLETGAGGSGVEIPIPLTKFVKECNRHVISVDIDNVSGVFNIVSAVVSVAPGISHVPFESSNIIGLSNSPQTSQLMKGSFEEMVITTLGAINASDTYTVVMRSWKEGNAHK